MRSNILPANISIHLDECTLIINYEKEGKRGRGVTHGDIERGEFEPNYKPFCFLVAKMGTK
jgi:hypothetical protein